MIINIIYLVLLALMLINIVFILHIINIKAEPISLIKRNKPDNICVLIPARNESIVIEKLLDSLNNQSYKINMNDVYVIVESLDDPTVQICEKYNVNVYLRTIFDIRTKGRAIDLCIKDILKNKRYDMYFIFDADNRLDYKFVEEMVESYQDGYDYVIGYRNSTNFTHNRITIASGLLFSFLNDLGNVRKNEK